MGSLKITLVIGAFLTMCVINNQGETARTLFLCSLLTQIVDTHANTPNGKTQSTCKVLQSCGWRLPSLISHLQISMMDLRTILPLHQVKPLPSCKSAIRISYFRSTADLFPQIQGSNSNCGVCLHRSRDCRSHCARDEGSPTIPEIPSTTHWMAHSSYLLSMRPELLSQCQMDRSAPPKFVRPH
jgi:hypothetical protein